MARSDVGNRIEHQDCRQMALVLEGLAGSVHAGHPIASEDLQTAAKAAEWVWEAGPTPGPAHSQDFEKARAHFVRASEGCAAGAPRDAGIVEQSAQRMANEFRWMGQELEVEGPRKELPVAATNVIGALASKYGRYGIRPMAAA
ncbi:MAG: hypothetical protein ACYDBQ_10715 [Thermoplasmatota archaeon]